MKYLLLSSLLIISSTAWTLEYSENDGYSAPGTIEDASGSDTGSVLVKKKITTTGSTMIEKEEAPIGGSESVSPDQMNTAPNPAPTTQGEILEDTTLSTGLFDKVPSEVEAQEEDALDYSTTPQKRTTKPLGPNKK